jgi:hypothetical protein
MRAGNSVSSVLPATGSPSHPIRTIPSGKEWRHGRTACRNYDKESKDTDRDEHLKVFQNYIQSFRYFSPLIMIFFFTVSQVGVIRKLSSIYPITFLNFFMGNAMVMISS